MKKILFLSFVVSTVLFTAYAEEAKAVEKIAAVKSEDKNITAPKVSKPVTPAVQKKSKKLVGKNCVVPAKPATASKPSKAALKTVKPVTPVKPATPALGTVKPVIPVKPVTPVMPVKPASGICETAEKPTPPAASK